MESLIEEALARHPRIRAAESLLAAAATLPEQARSLPDPTLTVGYQNDGAGFSLGSEIMTRISFMWTQPLPYPGKLELAGQILERDVERAQLRLERERLSLRAEIERAYARLLLARDLDRLVDEQEAALRQTEAVARARYAVGQAAQQEVLRAQVELTRIEQSRAEQEAELSVRRAELNQLLDRPSDQALETGAALAHPRDVPELESFMASARARSPELREATLLGTRAQLQIELARKNLRPDFTLNGGYMNRGDLPLMWQASVGITLPLFKKHKQEVAIREAQALEQVASAAARDVELKLRYRSAERLARLQATQRIAELYGEGVLIQDQLSVEAALASYRTGQLPFISVLEALSSLYADRALHLSQLAQLRLTRADLEELNLEQRETMSGSTALAGMMPDPPRSIQGMQAEM